jgi:hypothetical protein
MAGRLAGKIAIISGDATGCGGTASRLRDAKLDLKRKTVDH